MTPTSLIFCAQCFLSSSEILETFLDIKVILSKIRTCFERWLKCLVRITPRLSQMFKYKKTLSGIKKFSRQPYLNFQINLFKFKNKINTQINDATPIPLNSVVVVPRCRHFSCFFYCLSFVVVCLFLLFIIIYFYFYSLQTFFYLLFFNESEIR